MAASSLAFFKCCGVYLENEVIMEFRRVRRWVARSVPAVAVGGAIFSCLAPNAFAQSFPFGSELRLDADPMRGSKKIPVLDIGENGTAEIELWCNSVKAQLVVAANTITIITGEMTARQCPPDRARADDELLAALNQATNWQMEDSALVFTGGTTLRFRVQTN
jgi:heat shock protein HslJ